MRANLARALFEHMVHLSEQTYLGNFYWTRAL